MARLFLRKLLLNSSISGPIHQVMSMTLQHDVHKEVEKQLAGEKTGAINMQSKKKIKNNQKPKKQGEILVADTASA